MTYYIECSCDVCQRQRPRDTRTQHRHVWVEGGKGRVRVIIGCYCTKAASVTTRHLSSKTLESHVWGCRCRTCTRVLTKKFYGSKKRELKARRFLQSHLTTKQKYQLAFHGYIDVLDKNGGKWRLDCFGYSGNAWKLWKNGTWAGYCVVKSQYDLPTHDMYLAQLLMLKTNPRLFLKTGYTAGTTRAKTSLWLRPWDGE